MRVIFPEFHSKHFCAKLSIFKICCFDNGTVGYIGYQSAVVLREKERKKVIVRFDVLMNIFPEIFETVLSTRIFRSKVLLCSNIVEGLNHKTEKSTGKTKFYLFALGGLKLFIFEENTGL